MSKTIKTVVLVIILIIAALIIRINLTGEVVGVESEDKYSLEEISQHNTKQDCWMSSEGKVYDITLFLQVYPEDLSENCGKVVRLESFPADVKKILEEYEIGIIGG